MKIFEFALVRENFQRTAHHHLLEERLICLFVRLSSAVVGNQLLQNGSAYFPPHFLVQLFAALFRIHRSIEILQPFGTENNGAPAVRIRNTLRLFGKAFRLVYRSLYNVTEGRMPHVVQKRRGSQGLNKNKIRNQILFLEIIGNKTAVGVSHCRVAQLSPLVGVYDIVVAQI